MPRQHARSGSTNPSAAAGRGLLLVLLAVAIGVLLLARAVDRDDDPVIAGAPRTTLPAEDGGTDAAPADQTQATAPAVTTIPTAHANPGDVIVLVANGRAVQGAAAANRDHLLAQGYNVLAPTDHPNTPQTNVFFESVEWQADALAVAQTLEISAGSVVSFPAEPFPIDIKSAKVVVVLGTDGQGQRPS
jgi:hypothetical protein